MKNILYIGLFLGLTIPLNAQHKAIFTAFGKSDLSLLTEELNDEVAFCLNSGQKNISKSQVITTLKAFLEDIGPKSCRQMHVGDSKVKGSYYALGKLKSDKGNYRLFLYFENNKIVELRVDPY